MQIRDRIKELRRVRADALRPNPRNWRGHPPAQQEALRGVLSEIGFAGALLARELTDGSLEIIDGHLRAETVADALVPVLVLDVNEAEANKLLATFDTIGAAATLDYESLNALVVDIDFASLPLRRMVDGLAKPLTLAAESKSRGEREKQLDEVFQVVVECENEAEQQDVYERLVAEGFACKLRSL